MNTTVVAPVIETASKEPVSKELAHLQNKIETRQARIGILGLGYVGLPLAIEFAKAGFSVTGFDVEPTRVRTLTLGQSHIADVPSDDVRLLTEKKRFSASTNFSLLATMDVAIVCVPTPLRKSKDPDISYIAEATRQIARSLRPQQLIILESTTYPGTTREFVLPLLEAHKMKVGKDIYLAFSPERIDPGNSQFRLANTPKVVGGITPACGMLAALLYKQIVAQVVPVSSTESAEMVKLLENTYRAVNIGLVNEMAMICDRLGMDVWEVIEAAATKPYGFMPFYPGPGLGGHCIPIDPHYLSWKMKGLNFSARFIDLAEEVNSHMPDFVVNKLLLALNQRKQALNGSDVLLLGITYKSNVSDVRESPALDLMQHLVTLGANVSYHDPWVPFIDVGGKRFKSRGYSAALLKSMDAVVVTVSHNAFDAKDILANAKLVLDTRNITRGLKANNLVRL